MNQLNYGSLEACKRLVDAGIVLETEVYWVQAAIGGWFLQPKNLMETKYRFNKYIPAPSMVEIWRELPDIINDNYELALYKLITGSQAGYIMGSIIFKPFIFNTNPTDALIDLLIWVRKENHA